MSTLTTTRNYQDGVDLTESQLDDALDSIETWANGNIGSTNIASGGVASTNIAAAAVTAAKIDTDAVTTTKILDANVTTAKIADAQVTTAKIADAAVTQAKRVALGQQVSSSCGSYSVSGDTSAHAITNLNVTITTTGRPVYVLLTSDGSGSSNSGSWNQGAVMYSTFRLKRDSTTIAEWTVTCSNSSAVLPANFQHVDVASAGTYTYTMYVQNSATSAFQLFYCKLMAFEL